MDFKAFVKKNELKQKDVAAYLGITEAAVSNLVKGKAKPSKANLIKIMENPEWDVSMLVEPSVTITQSGHHNIIGDGNVGGSDDVARLNDMVCRLEQQVKNMQSLIDAQAQVIEAQRRMLGEI